MSDFVESPRLILSIRLSRVRVLALPLFCAVAVVLTGCGGGGGKADEIKPDPGPYTLSGTVSSVSEPGLAIANGSEIIEIPVGATKFSFATPLVGGAAYNIRVVRQPLGFTIACSFSNNAGTISNASVANVQLSCHPAKVMVSSIKGLNTEYQKNMASIPASVSASPSLRYPDMGVAVDEENNLYIINNMDELLRKVTPDGVTSVIAGKENSDFYDKDNFFIASRLVVNKDGTFFVVDRGHSLIRKVDATGRISTLAGSGEYDSRDGVGKSASFKGMGGIARDIAGNIYVTDSYVFPDALYANILRKINSDLFVSTVYGDDGRPVIADDVAADKFGNLYIIDNDFASITNLCPYVKKLGTDGKITILAGGKERGYKDGPASTASFGWLTGIAVDDVGNVYVSDTQNSSIRKISQSGMVSTVAGTGVAGAEDGEGTVASFYAPGSLVADKAGNLYVAVKPTSADIRYLIRKISPQ